MKRKLLTEIRKACVQDEKIVHILTDIYKLLEERLPSLSDISPFPTLTPDVQKEQSKPADAFSDSELVTIKEAADMLHVSRWKIFAMRKARELTTLEKNGQVRLIKTEVEAAKCWYSGPKGKI